MTPRDLAYLLPHHSLSSRFDGMRGHSLRPLGRHTTTGERAKRPHPTMSPSAKEPHSPPDLRRHGPPRQRLGQIGERRMAPPLSVECPLLEIPRAILSSPADVRRMRTLPPGAEFVGESQPTAGISRGNWRILPTLAFNYSPQGLSCAL